MGPVIGGPKGDALHLDHQKERRLITLLQTGAQLFHMPVSYTHLDVYKRQATGWVQTTM